MTASIFWWSSDRLKEFEARRLIGRMASCNDPSVRFIPVILLSLLLALPALSVELHRYRGAAMDGGTLEYVFDSDEQNVPQSVTKEKVAAIAADFMTTFYGVLVGALETQEFRQEPIPFWLVCFSDTIKGPLHQLYFVVILPDGRVVEPMVEKRL